MSEDSSACTTPAEVKRWSFDPPDLWVDPILDLVDRHTKWTYRKLLIGRHQELASILGPSRLDETIYPHGVVPACRPGGHQ